MAIRLLAAAPLASANGIDARMKVNDVITIGRKRSLAAEYAASAGDLPVAPSSTANSTIRIAFFAASPMSTSSPTVK